MKKIGIFSLSVFMLFILAACGRDYEAPVIEGVQDEDVLQGSTFDPMEGVSAYDYDGNDLTDDIEVDGFVNTNILGEHNLTYSVTDDQEQTTTINRYITVIFETEEPYQVYNGNFELGTGGWSLDQPGGEAAWNVENDVLQVDITNPGSEWWQLQIYQLIEIFEGDMYKIEITARSAAGKTLGIGFEDTTAGYAMIAGGTYAIALDEDFETYTFYFESDRSIDAAKFVMYLGQMDADEAEAIVEVESVSIELIDPNSGDLSIEGADDIVIMLNDDFDSLEGISAHDGDSDVLDNLVVQGEVRTNVSNRTPFVVQYVLDIGDNLLVESRIVDVEIGSAANRIFNTDFDLGITGWTVDFPGNYAEGSMRVEEGTLEVDITDLGAEYWHIQLSQSGKLIEEGITYELSFRARADQDKVVGLGIEDASDGFASLTDGIPEWTVGSEYETYTFEFTANETLDNVKYALFFGQMAESDEPTTVYVEHFRLREVVPSGESVLQNPDMTEEAGWNFDFPVGEGTMTYEDGTIVADLTDLGDAWWHIQLQQDGIEVSEGMSYLLSITLKSSETRMVGIGLENPDDGFASAIDEALDFEVGDEYITYYYLFTPDQSYSNLKIALFLGDINDDPLSTVTVKSFDLIASDGQNLLENSNFETEDHWAFDFPVGEGSMRVEDNTLIAELTDIGDAWWHIQLAQLGLEIQAGETYLVTFRAASSEPRRIGLGIEDAADGFRDLKGGEPAEWDLTTEMRTYTFVFNSEDSIDSAKFALFFGWHIEGDTPTTIEVQDFQVIHLVE